ncbi:MAG: hypothetical protein A2W86_11900 [Bacteroidetes bacterium GWD2_45_23]|nr:MAG: hypothetical protein A2W87_08115 [Bacteroidetes bacterium GWC2_46_850]OFX85524.1 MAG: hypothetical protein A2W86_11900 [Bacteroidetes bacterium GWD2_45_23]HBB00751.1 hypothetical protein [Porphyromonadaceae bacterium]HCC19376.1 hypothetical protein [Porphyromonadaceae bacterium]
MKKYLPILFLLLLIGCKPKQILTERTVTKVDSTAITSLKSELQKKIIEVETLKSDLERSRDEVSRLESESSSHTIIYDTTAQVIPETGKYPILQEIITTTKSQLDRTIKEMESLKQEHVKEMDSLTTVKTNLALRVEKLAYENRELKKKIIPMTGFNFKIFIWGMVLGAFITLIIFFRKKLQNILSFFRLF